MVSLQFPPLPRYQALRLLPKRRRLPRLATRVRPESVVPILQAPPAVANPILVPCPHARTPSRHVSIFEKALWPRPRMGHSDTTWAVDSTGTVPGIGYRRTYRITLATRRCRMA